MNISIIAGLAFLLQVSSEPVTAEKVAVISIKRCLVANRNQVERDALMEDIAFIDAEARDRVEAMQAAEAGIGADSTELERTQAKLLRAEFELFRLRKQQQLRDAEEKMLNDSLKRVEVAVSAIAKQKGCTVVVYERTQDSSVAVNFTAKQIISVAPRSFVSSNKGRIDITDDVIAWLAKNKANANKE
ncbi:MAG: OmpH family outer membrane protein [Fuerstiella sp.]|jgi:Skp family chaperone for outer membrane proteins